MLKITLTSETADGLRALLEKEESNDARLRIREFRVGCG
jgi:Fe-S cluster assembly iron-binding protein IscA